MGRILSIDYGDRRVGLAVSDSARIFSFPLKVLENKPVKTFKELGEVITEKGIDLIIIGYPLRTDGERSKTCDKVDDFINKINEYFPDLKIITWDERFTSKMATDVLVDHSVHWSKRKSVVDAIAASLILQNYLESVK